MHMEFLKNLSDDQIALLGCLIALVSTGSLMSLSYYIGRGRISAAAGISLESSVRMGEMTGDALRSPQRRDAA